MDERELAEALDGNFAVHAAWATRRLPDADVREDADLVVIDSGLPGDTFNVVCRARLEGGTARSRAAGVIARFAERRRGFSWWLSPADRPRDLEAILVEAGLAHAESERAMAFDLSRLSALETGRPAPKGFEIRPARTPRDLDDFAAVASNSNEPDPAVAAYYRLAAEALLSPESPQRLFVGRLDGAPVAAAELTIGGGVAGLYAVVTREAFRGRGFGAAVTAAALREARARGCGVAVLQASGGGEGLYRALGFTSFGEVRELKPRSIA